MHHKGQHPIRGTRRELGREGKSAWKGSTQNPMNTSWESLAALNMPQNFDEKPNQEFMTRTINSEHREQARYRYRNSPMKVARNKARWKRMSEIDDPLINIPFAESYDDSSEFFQYESDLSLNLTNLGSDGTASDYSSPVSSPLRLLSGARGSTDNSFLNLYGQTSIMGDDDPDDIAPPIPLIKTRSYLCTQNLDTIMDTLFSTIFPVEEVASSGMRRQATSSQLAWDAADDSDESDNDESVSSDDTFILGADGEGWVVPRVPRVEKVASVWFREQIRAHAGSYRGPLELENPLTSEYVQ